MPLTRLKPYSAEMAKMKNLKEKRQQDRDYRKKLGDIYRARQREHFKKYHANNREKERAKCRLYQELKKLERSGVLKSAGNVEYIKQVFSPNGTTVTIFFSLQVLSEPSDIRVVLAIIQT